MSESDGATPEVDAAVAELVDETARRRASLDFAALPPWSARSGSDPWALLVDGSRTLGLLRRGRVVVLDEHGGVAQQASTVVGATAMVRAGDELVISSETTGELDVLDARTLVAVGVDGFVDVSFAHLRHGAHA